MSVVARHEANSAEVNLRADIAVCTRMLNHEGIIGYSGHVSARLPDGDSFLVQDFDQSRATLQPESLVVCDLDGRLLAGAAGLRPPSEVYIHSEIYKQRPDVGAVAHFHHDLTTVFSVVDGATLVPLKNHAVRWRSGVPVHADPSHVDSRALGAQLAATLGAHEALLIRAHGEVVVAEDVRALFVDCVHFVENAEALYRASAIGRVLPLTDREMDDFARTFRRDRHVAKVWKYYLSRAREAGLVA